MGKSSSGAPTRPSSRGPGFTIAYGGSRAGKGPGRCCVRVNACWPRGLWRSLCTNRTSHASHFLDIFLPAPRGERSLVHLAVSARTDTGRLRKGNEDNLYADANEYRGLFIVADGMGGHAAGEVASQMAVDLIASELADLNDLASPDSKDQGVGHAAAREPAGLSAYDAGGREDGNGQHRVGPAALGYQISSSGTSATRGSTSCATER